MRADRRIGAGSHRAIHLVDVRQPLVGTKSSDLPGPIGEDLNQLRKSTPSLPTPSNRIPFIFGLTLRSCTKLTKNLCILFFKITPAELSKRYARKRQIPPPAPRRNAPLEIAPIGEGAEM